ncbi:hypothetical protein ABM34_01515 [Companilactobacillus ginsenosidimutans]|uniref:Uncharacterized protein n=1 Tax=Companilactobacillus ginsenosidimutans TaxID=1007676 RepID=A0A0H4QH56_9LACO|nr:hypothetical protein ABM34_01515 [Companilactobacillus ginsenosidimutans]
MIKITEDTSYINFLNDNDENFTKISNNISNAYKLLQSLYMTDRSYTPSFKKLVNSVNSGNKM